jgi:hypothetical protein
LLDFTRSLAQDLSILEADQAGEGFLSRAKSVTQAAHYVRTLRGWHYPSAQEGLLRFGDRSRALSFARGPNARQTIASGGIYGLDRWAGRLPNVAPSVRDARNRATPQ